MKHVHRVLENITTIESGIIVLRFNIVTSALAISTGLKKMADVGDFKMFHKQSTDK
jgi:hypothetical protein